MKPSVLCITRNALTTQNVPETNAFGIYPFNIDSVPINKFHFINREIVDSSYPKHLEIGQELPQILGYIAVINDKNEVLTYSRGKGAEVRLKKRSIGIGGHCDDADIIRVSAVNGSINYHCVLKESIRREVEEEIGLSYSNANSNYLGLLVDTTDDVGSVHVGLAYTYQVIDLSDLSFDLNELSDPQWIHIDQLKQDKDLYENWSQLVIDTF